MFKNIFKLSDKKLYQNEVLEKLNKIDKSLSLIVKLLTRLNDDLILSNFEYQLIEKNKKKQELKKIYQKNENEII